MTATPTKTRPEVSGLIITASGRRYCVVSAGGAGSGQPDLVAESSRALVCLRRVCIDANTATTCPHATAARAYLDALDAPRSAGALGRAAA